MRSILLPSVILAIAVSPSLGSIVLVQDTREVRAEASVSSPNGTDADGPNSSTPIAFGADFNAGALANAVVAGAGAGAASVQLSTITASQINAQGSVSLSSTVGTGGSGLSAARSVVDLLFTVPHGTGIELIAAQSGVGVIELRNAQDEVLFSGSGVYRAALGGTLHLYAGADASLTTPPSGSTGGGYSLIFNAVPAPSIAGMVFGIASLALRRRR